MSLPAEQKADARAIAWRIVAGGIDAVDGDGHRDFIVGPGGVANGHHAVIAYLVGMQTARPHAPAAIHHLCCRLEVADGGPIDDVRQGPRLSFGDLQVDGGRALLALGVLGRDQDLVEAILQLRIGDVNVKVALLRQTAGIRADGEIL